ncbi:hypothetical protein [Francisella hispaniensis]|uniref:Uncharacterized protein n=1 Tax=Francisella hispaniensis TaxID=622488 RepID=F4BFS3_9GAMM|nr:hypothetical protein [Francisella hispaniensis]AEE26317.1 hypothetical protein FN3523_1014 [Francisella hispaniensis]
MGLISRFSAAVGGGASGSGAVDSVNGLTGNVIITATGLGALTTAIVKTTDDTTRQAITNPNEKVLYVQDDGKVYIYSNSAWIDVTNTIEIVDNLTSTDTDKSISANQARILNGNDIDSISYDSVTDSIIVTKKDTTNISISLATRTAIQVALNSATMNNITAATVHEGFVGVDADLTTIKDKLDKLEEKNIYVDLTSLQADTANHKTNTLYYTKLEQSFFEYDGTNIILVLAISGSAGAINYGIYSTLAALQAAHPTVAAGDQAYVDTGAGNPMSLYYYDVDDGWITSGATSSLTAAEIKTLYEDNADTNAFTDAEKTKLASLVSNYYGSVSSSMTLMTSSWALGDYAWHSAMNLNSGAYVFRGNSTSDIRIMIDSSLVVDSLTSTSITQPLSARQGFELDQKKLDKTAQRVQSISLAGNNLQYVDELDNTNTINLSNINNSDESSTFSISLAGVSYWGDAQYNGSVDFPTVANFWNSMGNNIRSLTQINSANQPIYGVDIFSPGVSGISFNGGQWLNVPFDCRKAATPELAYIAVIQPINITAAPLGKLFGSDGGWGRVFGFDNRVAGFNFGIFNGSGVQGITTLEQGVTYVVACRWSIRDGVSVWVNLQKFGRYLVFPEGQTSASIGAQVGGFESFIGRKGDIILCRAAMSDERIESIISFLMRKYGLS